MPLSGLFFVASSPTRKLVYGSFGISALGIAVKMSPDLYPLIASRTVTASCVVRQWMPARSPACFPVMPPSWRMPFVVRRLTTLFRDAGPLHEAQLCSQIEQATRLAATDVARSTAGAARHSFGVVGIAGLAAPGPIGEVAVGQH